MFLTALGVTKLWMEQIYPIMPQDSKMYRHNLEVYGGKLNVMMDDFTSWFGGLWHGKSLAVIIGCTAILLSFGFFYRANYLMPRLKSDATKQSGWGQMNFFGGRE